MEARAKELAKAARRVGQAQGMHGKPQFEALRSQFEEAWPLFMNGIDTNLVPEGLLSEFARILDKAKELLQQEVPE